MPNSGAFLSLLFAGTLSITISIASKDIYSSVSCAALTLSGFISLTVFELRRKANPNPTLWERIRRKRCHDFDIDNPIILKEQITTTLLSKEGDITNYFTDEFPTEPDIKVKTINAWRCKKCGYVGLYGLDKEDIVRIMTPGSFSRDLGYNCDNKGD